MERWCVHFIYFIYLEAEYSFQLPFNDFTHQVDRRQFRELVATAYDVLIDSRVSGIALPDAFEQVERLYLWIDDYMPKLDNDLEGKYSTFPNIDESYSLSLFSV